MSVSSFLESAIEAHTKWKIRLLAAVNGGEVPDRGVVSQDNQCDLGKWIHGAGAKEHGALSEFVELREQHRRFHASLGGVIDLLRADKKDAAKEAIMTGEYARASQAVVRAIGALKRRAA
jgi:Chemoreceptor zinc-binding domain